jgi:uncharacterized phiE125 gp8 family phage protein
MRVEQQLPEPGPAALADTKTYLRISQAEEDILLASLIRTATGLCERFVGQALIVREVTEQ